MKNAFIVSGIALLVMLGSRYMYLNSPNYVAADGTLVEAFGCIPLFRFAGLVFVMSVLVGLWKWRRNQTKKPLSE